MPEATSAELPAAKPDKTAHDLSPMGMFLNADPVVKAVMVLLAAASVVTWTILLVKALGLGMAKRRMRASLNEIRASGTLTDAGKRVSRGVGALLLVEAEEELALSRGLPSEGIKERVAIALQRIEAMVGKRMASGTGILATIGSIGPFVGLFGTVWGIMGSFIGIANSNTTNLAVVAPGIAEALLATGIGLVAAIPAVVIYNALTRSITGYRAMTGDAVALIMRHLSRDLDRREFGTSAPKVSMRVAAE
ncbi:tonB-system energizer ExbB [Methylorubrum thiocyanatum]